MKSLLQTTFVCQQHQYHCKLKQLFHMGPRRIDQAKERFQRFFGLFPNVLIKPLCLKHLSWQLMCLLFSLITQSWRVWWLQDFLRYTKMALILPFPNSHFVISVQIVSCFSFSYLLKHVSQIFLPKGLNFVLPWHCLCSSKHRI